MVLAAPVGIQRAVANSPVSAAAGARDGLRVAHLNQNHVGVFAQCGTQGVGEAVGVLVARVG